MKPSFKIFSVYILILILIVLASSCNSVKRVLKDPVKFEQVAKEVVKRGYCINDTVIVSKDSIIYNTKDSIITDSILVPLQDFEQTLPNGTKVTIKNGVLTVSSNIKNKEKIITKTITNNIRDKKLEDILRKEADSLQILLKKSYSDLKETKAELKKAERKNLYTWLGIAGIVLLGIGIKTGLLKKLIPFL